MAMRTQTSTGPEQDETVKKIQPLREQFADAPELGRTALERAFVRLVGALLLEQNDGWAVQRGPRHDTGNHQPNAR